MNKQKLKHVPGNLICCLSSYFVSYLLLLIYTDINNGLAVGISIIIYLIDVMNSSTNDYFEEKIKELEERLSKK